MALSYGGRWDIVQAAQQLAREAASGALRPEDIGEERFAAGLALAGLPPVDLLIRTGGEQRISNFLLWDLAYAELYFADVPVAGLHRRRPGGGARVLRRPRAALRANRRTARGGEGLEGIVPEPLRKRVLTAAVLAAAALAILLWLPGWVTVAAMTVMALAGAWEWSAFLLLDRAGAALGLRAADRRAAAGRVALLRRRGSGATWCSPWRSRGGWSRCCG